jgi:hypothetical protein
MNINFRGHLMNEENVKKALEREINFYKKILNPEALDIIFKRSFYIDNSCFTCGVSPEFQTKNGETFEVVIECPFKDGFPPIEVNLEVPSGKILLFNNFRRFYNNDFHNINICSDLGKKQYTEHFAKQGLIIHFVGNTCPSVVQVSDERLNIGNYSEEEGDTGIIGTICTDLWWYCAVDQADFEKRIEKSTDQFEKEYHETGAWPNVIRAKVIPGTYRTVGQYHLDKDKLFSFIERIK